MEDIIKAESTAVSFYDRIENDVNVNGALTTIDTSTIDGKKKLYKAKNASEPLGSFMETPLQIEDIAFVPVTITDEETGEVYDQLGVVLVDTDGKAYMSSASGVVRSAADLLATFADAERRLPEPISVVCRERNTRRGRRFKYLDIA